MKIFLTIVFCSLFITIFFIPLNAECIKDDSSSSLTNIKCDTERTYIFYIAGFSENKQTTNVIPLYTNKDIYAIVQMTGINVNNDNHVLNIGTPNSARIDVSMELLNNKVGNEAINIYGQDSLGEHSHLDIKKLSNNYGNVTINGENNNIVNINNSTISGNLAIKNITANLGNLTVNNINIDNTKLSLTDASSNIKIEDINLQNNSNLFIESNGSINSISSKDNTKNNLYFLGNSTLLIKDINFNGSIFLKNNTNVSVSNKLVAKELIFEDSAMLNAQSVVINNLLKLNNSLLKVNNFEFLTFSNSATLELNVNKIMTSQGSLTSGIYAQGNINIENTLVKLHFNDTYKIKLKENSVYEILYSKNGKITYSPSLFENTSYNSLFDINYNIINENGTSLVAEITRKKTYCQVINCNDHFVKYIAEHLEQQNNYNYTNINNLKNAIDNNPSSQSILSLQPISNDILLLQSYLNNKTILDIPEPETYNKDDNFSVFSSFGKINDNIFNNKSSNSIIGAYYSKNLFNNFNFGLSLNKAKLDNTLYYVDNIGLLFVSKYNTSFSNNFINLTTAIGFNNYNKNKSNFNNDKALSNALASNFIEKIKLYKNYYISKLKITPSAYYALNYSMLRSSTEKGTGLLYDTKKSNVLISDFNLGLDAIIQLDSKTSLISSLGLSYLNYSSSKTSSQAFELSEDFLNFGNNIYNKIGSNISLGINYKIKESSDLSFMYKNSFYSSALYVNSIIATFNFKF